MLESLHFYPRYQGPKPELSILLPTWNNLPFLQCCVRSLRAHSRCRWQLIVLVNEGKDGTLEWLEEQGDIDYVHAEKNIGICWGMNSCRALVKAPYIAYLNDDMYVLPDWDKVLLQEIAELNSPNFMLSGTMIEAHDSGNPCVVVRDFGTELESFREKELLAAQQDLQRGDWMGSSWPPLVLPTALWDLVGGFSVEFSPGMYSDPDLSRKLYEAGVRIFKGCGKSLVYHFGSKSTRRVRKNTGRKQFILKWGISAKTFYKHYLKMGQDYRGPSIPPIKRLENSWLARLKRMWNS